MAKIDQNNLKVPAFLRQKSIKDNLKKTRGRKKRISSVQRSNSDYSIPIAYPISKTLNESSDYSKGIRKMVLIGEIEQYFEKINVIAVTINYPLRVGDRILIETEDGMYEQTLSSMQIDREDIRYANQGSDIGIKVLLPPLTNGRIYKAL